MKPTLFLLIFWRDFRPLLRGRYPQRAKMLNNGITLGLVGIARWPALFRLLRDRGLSLRIYQTVVLVLLQTIPSLIHSGKTNCVLPGIAILFEIVASWLRISRAATRKSTQAFPLSLFIHSFLLPAFSGLSLLYLYHEQHHHLFPAFIAFGKGVYGPTFSLCNPPPSKLNQNFAGALEFRGLLEHTQRAGSWVIGIREYLLPLIFMDN
jgi:hypothetical protein